MGRIPVTVRGVGLAFAPTHLRTLVTRANLPPGATTKLAVAARMKRIVKHKPVENPDWAPNNGGSRQAAR